MRNAACRPLHLNYGLAHMYYTKTHHSRRVAEVMPKATRKRWYELSEQRVCTFHMSISCFMNIEDWKAKTTNKQWNVVGGQKKN